MKANNRGRLAIAGVTLAGIMALSGCGPKEVAQVLPPPPQIVVPPQPRPPLGAAPNVPVPPLLSGSSRQTVNSGITPAQTLWNFRSAYNVAALNCMKTEHAALLEGYRGFLKNNAKALNAANKTVDQEFKTRFGPTFVRSREAYMTQVYNYFALPPTLQGFCDEALAINAAAQTVKPAELDAFAARSLTTLDTVFQDFFVSYDQYRTDLAGWQARYFPAQAAAASSVTLPATVPGQPLAPTAQ